MATRQQFRTVDVLKLEVARRPGGVRNGIPNPRGELGSWGWTTPVPGSEISSANGQRTYVTGAGELLLTAFTVGGVAPATVQANSAPTPAVPGQWYAARATLLAGSASNSNVAMRLEFKDAAGALLASTPLTSPARNTTQYVTAAQAPAGTVTHEVCMRGHTGAAVLAPGAWASFTQVMTATGATATAADAAVGVFVDAWEWVDILSPTTYIDIKRAPMQPGTLSATIYDASLDPAIADALIRPGAPVRVRAVKSDASFGPLGTFEITRPTTDYDPVQVDADHKVKITLTAVDNLHRVANVSCPNGVAQVAHLSGFFEGSLVPWNLNNDPNGEALDTPVVSRNARATLLDQVLITRDTRRAHAYVDAYGSMTVIDPATMPAPSVIAKALVGSDFRAPKIAFDPGACVNSLTVKALQAPVDDAADSDVLIFGPYVDAASRDRHGTYHSEATVHGLTAAEIGTYAAAMLASNGTPIRRITGLTLPMWTATDIHTKAHLELTDRVTVTSAAASLATAHARISGIHHEIHPEKWLIHHDYSDPNGVPLPATTTAPTRPVSTAVGVDTPWQTIGYTNGWGTLPGWEAAAYCRRAGVVYWRGMVSGGATADGTNITQNVPNGFRPALTRHHPVATAAGYGCVKVDVGGTLVCGSPVSGTWTSLNGISYPAEQ